MVNNQKNQIEEKIKIFVCLISSLRTSKLQRGKFRHSWKDCVKAEFVKFREQLVIGSM